MLVENRKRLSASALALMMIAAGTVRAQDPPLMPNGIEGERATWNGRNRFVVDHGQDPANLRKSYSELERARQLSQMAQKMGASMALLMNASSNSDSAAVSAARAELEVEVLEADFVHRQAFAALRAQMGTAVSPGKGR